MSLGVASLIAVRLDRCGRSRRRRSDRLLPIVFTTLLMSTLGWHADAIGWQLTATWVEDATMVVDGYSLERATLPDGTYAQVATTASGVTTYTDSTVTAGTTYCYRARAFNSAGYSVYSNVVCAAPAVSALTAYRQSTGQWFGLLPTGQIIVLLWGGCLLCGDVPVPANYNGDATTDVAVFRPNAGTWFILRSSDLFPQQILWGAPGDVPVAGDYDGDGKADVAVFRPSTGAWYILRSSDGALQQTLWGASGDVPVTGDFDGDGKTDVAVFRPSTGIWYILRSSDGTLEQVQWGSVGDQPLVLRHR